VTKWLPFAVLLSLLMTFACGGGEDAEPAAEGDEADVTRWAQQICAADQILERGWQSAPRANEDAATLSLLQRRERAEVLFPARIRLLEDNLKAYQAIPVPAAASEVHRALEGFDQAQIDGLKLTLAEAGTVFASQAALDAHNAAAMRAETAARDRVDSALRGHPEVLKVLAGLPECGGNFVPD
jgi:hypothetical protein